MYKWVNIKPKTQNFTLPVFLATVLFFPLWSGQRGPRTSVTIPTATLTPHRTQSPPRKSSPSLTTQSRGEHGGCSLLSPWGQAWEWAVLPWLLWIHVMKYRSNTPFPFKILFFLPSSPHFLLSFSVHFLLLWGRGTKDFYNIKNLCYHSNSFAFQIHQEVINLFFFWGGGGLGNILTVLLAVI